MKFRKGKRKGAWYSEPKLGDEIPPLRRRISETGPSVPSDLEHAKVKWQVKPFGLLDEDSFQLMKHYSMHLTSTNGALSYASENDVAGFVKTLVSRVIVALELEDDLEVHSEIATFSIRPDLWAVTRCGVPIGVIEVKKPDIAGGVRGLEHPNILGELYDFMRHLPNYYGVAPVFGILTNFASWRIAWLPDDGTDALAAESVSFAEDDDEEAISADLDDVSLEANRESTERASHGPLSHSPLRHSASKTNPVIHMVDEAEQEEAEEEHFEDDHSDRFFHVSKVYARTDPDHAALRAIASAIVKMKSSKWNPFITPFDRLSERTLLKFVKGEGEGAFWARLNTQPRWDKVGSPKKYLFAIEDLGRGADGRVWLTSTASGAVCVLKFSIDDKPDKLDHECIMWKRAYPRFKVHKETWCGHPALRMPHFSMVQTGAQAKCIELVRKTLMTDFAKNSLMHNDVYWRNIGFYKDRSGSEKSGCV